MDLKTAIIGAAHTLGIAEPPAAQIADHLVEQGWELTKSKATNDPEVLAGSPQKSKLVTQPAATTATAVTGTPKQG